ncbi:MAG: tetratricopeptide repeat protein [Thermodesulfobacteriota bacterium]
MKHNRVIIWLGMFFLWGISVARASENAALFLEGIKQYQQKEYHEAANRFQQIAASGIVNGALYYNLGNAYLKSGDIGRAVLWYERARKILPRDPDLKFNLNYARSLVKDEAGFSGSPLYRVLFFWNHLLGQTEILWSAVICNLILWVILVLRKITAHRVWTYVSLPLSLITFIFVSTALYNYYETVFEKQAVVLPAEVAVRSGLSEEDTQLFQLHAGSRVKIDTAKGDCYRIYFSEGKIGWIRKKEVEPISL